MSPIFFGYTLVTLNQRSSVVGSEEQSELDAEIRALERAKRMKVDAREELEKRMANFTATREKRIADVKGKYEQAQEKRNQEMLKNQKLLNPTAFKLYLAEWTVEKNEAEQAYQLELTRMENAHQTQLNADKEALRTILNEQVLFEDSVSFERPTAALIEEISRAEITRWSEELQKRCSALEVIYKDF